MTNLNVKALDVNILDVDGLRDITPLVTDEQGRLKVVPSSVYEGTTQKERGVFCVRHGVYGLPTDELVTWLRGAIGTKSAIEIGAGTGVLARALGIPATNNRQQERPSVRAWYRALAQTPVPYGDDVETISANEAVEKYQPTFVISSWVTHKWRADRAEAGGNEDGVDEEHIIANCGMYIVIGNERVHRGKSIWSRRHTVLHHPFLYSRAMNGAPDFMAIWG